MTSDVRGLLNIKGEDQSGHDGVLCKERSKAKKQNKTKQKKQMVIEQTGTQRVW
ncbi:hypothetical protein LOAG_11783 [Loa loa]|uniref:Uncharacterized protein n=1 Tax=Loa loa TaxID=7209 RepID=A0A1S0TMD9_LOALO|nr:hypothetical protein LOAG_11783 [Loa loa]EFO16720.1 hypothetical protein LOAG_11783 [Loa loa]